MKRHCSRLEQDSECIAASQVREVATIGHDLRLCGDVGIVRREPVPWAYRDFQDRTDGESLRLHVTCEELD